MRNRTRTAAANDASVSNRRTFLKYVGAAFGGAVLSEGIVGCAVDALAPASVGTDAIPLDSSFTWGVTAMRPDDLLSLRFEFANLALDSAGKTLQRASLGNPTAIAIVFPPQHLLEAALGDVVAEPWAPSGILRVLAASSSRLVFLVPSSIDRAMTIDYSIRGILAACAQLPTSVEPNAQEGTGSVAPAIRSLTAPKSLTALSTSSAGARPHREARLREKLRRLDARSIDLAVGKSGGAGTPPTGVVGRGTPRAPASGETGIEILARLVVSPNEASRWQHAVDPFTSPWSQRTELWRTRLATAFADGRVLDAAHAHTTVRAVWTRDGAPDFNPVYPPASAPAPTLNLADDSPDGGSMLQPVHRAAIVHQSSNWAVPAILGAGVAPQPTPINVDQMMLSALGGFLHAEGAWPSRAMTTWRHRTSLGRDQYVLASAPGFLLPYGHRATRVTVAERWVDDAYGTWGYLRRYDLLVIDQPILAVDASASAHPFVAVAFSAKESPKLATALSGAGRGNSLYWPTVLSTQEPLRMGVTAYDKDGGSSTFDLPVAFTEIVDATSTGQYSGAAPALRSIDLAGQRVAFVESTKHSSAVETHAIVLRLAPFAAAPGGGIAPVTPSVDLATVSIEAARHLTDAPATAIVKYADAFVQSGFPGPNDTVHPNMGEAFLQLAQAPMSLSFQQAANRAGGLITPDLSITGLSRKAGAISGDITTYASGAFDPKKFFGGASFPKLFGVLDLASLVPGFDASTLYAKAQSAAMSMVPKCVTESLDAVERIVSEAHRFIERAQKGTLRFTADPGAAGAAAAQAVLDRLSAAITPLATDLAAAITALENQDLDALTGVRDFLSNPTAPPAAGSLLARLRADLDTIVNAYDDVAKSAPNLPVLGVGLYKELEKVTRALRGYLAALDAVVDAIVKIRQGLEAAKDLGVRLEWRPDLYADKPALMLDVLYPKSKNGLLLSLEARAKARKDPATGELMKSGVDVLCCIEDFELWVIGADPVVKLAFDRVFFRQKAGKKPEVDVVFHGLTFGGPLTILNKLRDIVPLDGLSDPPYLDVEADHIAAGFTLAVPSVSMGAFALRNVMLGAGVNLPFLGGGLSWGFDFCSKKAPFNLTVSLLGGGGYLALRGGAHGLDSLEASLEFGAFAALDLVVAQGEVSIAAGAYLHLGSAGTASDGTTTVPSAVFGGFLRIRGAVVILGLVGVTVELDADLQYDSGANQLQVSASISVEVDIGPFSKSVDLSYSTSISLGAPSSPMAPFLLRDAAANADAYAGYLAAFAAFAA